MHPALILAPCFLEIHSNIMFPSTSRPSEWLFPSDFQTKILHAFFISPMHDSYTSHLIFFVYRFEHEIKTLNFILPTTMFRRATDSYTCRLLYKVGQICYRSSVNCVVLPVRVPTRNRWEHLVTVKLRSLQRNDGALELWLRESGVGIAAFLADFTDIFLCLRQYRFLLNSCKF